MEQAYCQSCGMPMTAELYGTEKDGSTSADYCSYCYADGAFTSAGTMEEMIEICVPHMASPESGMTEETARNMMQQFFPTLKRWKA